MAEKKKVKATIFTDTQLLRMSEMEDLEKAFRAYYGLPDPKDDSYWYDGYEDELNELQRRWANLHPKHDEDKTGDSLDDPKFWKSIKHVVDAARAGASGCDPNSKEYWTFCAIIGELVMLMGDERFNKLRGI